MSGHSEFYDKSIYSIYKGLKLIGVKDSHSLFGYVQSIQNIPWNIASVIPEFVVGRHGICLDKEFNELMKAKAKSQKKTYIGGLKDGNMHGEGTLNSADGFIYKDGFKDGEMHGEGKLSWANGTYSGGFKDGKMHGEGTLTGADGRSYSGEFQDNEYHGQGTLTLETYTGSSYSGGFKDGKYHGEGTCTDATNGISYSGEFKDDKHHGEGIFTSADGKSVSFFDKIFVYILIKKVLWLK